MVDSERRSLAKTVTWRILAVIITFLVLYLIDGDALNATISTAIIHVIKSFVFYGHERIWTHLKWGVEE